MDALRLPADRSVVCKDGLHALEHRTIETDLRTYRRLARERGRRLAWSDLCPLCQARVRLGVARHFRSRANVLSGLLIASALASATISGEGLTAVHAAGYLVFCSLLAAMPVWLRHSQLDRVQKRTCAT